MGRNRGGVQSLTSQDDMTACGPTFPGDLGNQTLHLFNLRLACLACPSLVKKDDYPTYGNSDVVSNNGYYTGATDVDIGTATLQYGFLELVNEARTAEGHAPLSWVPSDAAEEHTLQRCYELVSNFSHDRPQGKFADEVCNKGAYSVLRAFNSLMDSPLHKESMMKDNYNYMSAAKAGSCWIICLWSGDFERVERFSANNYDVGYR